MKKLSYVLVAVLALSAMLISACGGSAATSAVSGGKPQASPIEFTGVIESINGDQWSINGQTITVDPAVVRDGPFKVGDTVKVEVQVQADGSMVVNRVETPSAVDNSNNANSNDTTSNSNSNDNGNDNSNANGNSNDNSNGGLAVDNSSAEAFGKVESITADTVVIDGQTFTIANGAEFKSQIQAGDFVKVHFSLNADGTMSITQIETWDPALVTNDNSNSNTNTSLDDHNGNANSNDSNSNDSNSNSNDDKSKDSNSNGGGDNSGGGGSSNDN